MLKINRGNFLRDNALIFSLLFSVFAFGMSLIFEFGYGEKPCTLCLWQRWPFLIAIIISLCGIFTRYQIATLWVLVGIFAFEAGVSSFHLLVQYGLVSDPCIVPKVASKEDFWNILNAPPPCSRVAWKILGIPTSAFNASFSIILVLLSGDLAIFKKN